MSSTKFIDWKLPDYSLNYFQNKENATAFYCRTLLGMQPNLNNYWDIPHAWKQLAAQYLDVHNIPVNKPICLIRPNTIRLEWPCPARNPKDEYLQLFIDTYKEMFTFVSLADVDGLNEVYTKKLTGCDLYIEKPPNLETTIGLFAISQMIVCSPSFWYALAPMLNKTCICIFGAAHPPDWLMDKRLRNSGLFEITPVPFEVCGVSIKNPYKDIPVEKLLLTFGKAVKHATDSDWT